MGWRVCGVAMLLACSSSSRPSPDVGTDSAEDVAVEAALDTGSACACAPGPHASFIYLVSDDGEIHRWDPLTNQYEFVVGPICSGATPFSMAVDGQGRAHLNLIDSLEVVVLDLLDPGACEPSNYVRTNADFGLFGMSFASNSAIDPCADLYVMTYSGDGAFDEGPDLGKLGAINPVSGDLRDIANIDFDGGELTGTGDGRLFAFAGDSPVKLIEYDRNTGARLNTIELTGVDKTNASAVAFFAGDIYLFTEALSDDCGACLDDGCSAERAACLATESCAEDLACVLNTGEFSDTCGGTLGQPLVDCVLGCDPCL
ncbi:MAG: hypothetical protein AAF938_26895, partial [Myxococcota bacterium]